MGILATSKYMYTPTVSFEAVPLQVVASVSKMTEDIDGPACISHVLRLCGGDRYESF